jgi:signal transduction histidine kinase
MRLSIFLLANLDEVMDAWEAFARSLEPGKHLAVTDLRDDAEEMLRFIARDMETDQSALEEIEKAHGRAPELPSGRQSAAHLHGLARATQRFSLGDLLAEYRALRASVSRMWLARTEPTYANVVQLVRFNEAVDQLIAESVVRYASKIEGDADLFTATIGHDLRSPLNAVATWAHVLVRTPALGDNERALATNIQHAAKRLADLVRDLQDFTRSRLGSALTVHRTTADVAAICESAVAELRAAHPMRTLKTERSGESTVNVDASRVAQAVSNLVANAIQHGDEAFPVTVSVVGTERAVEIRVHNRGQPIPVDELEAIFEPMKRLHADDQPGSLGLGLYIARRIAAAHGGTLTVSSSTEGTTFVLQLPRG